MFKICRANWQFTQIKAGLATACIAAALVTQVCAAPVAYWRFGDSASDPNFGLIAAGDAIQPTASRTIIEADPDPLNPPAYIPGYDSTGNGNTLFAWVEGWAGHYYRADVPAGTAGGSANQWSIQNGGDFPATFTWSAQSSPTGIDLETIAPAQWTIEASVKPTTVNNVFRTFVGREGNGVIAGGDANSAPLYFQMTNTNQFRINYTDAAGNLHIVDSPDTVLSQQWYHLAAVSDGSTLSLYVDTFDGTGYQLKGTADLSGSANSAMIDPGLDANGDTLGWTIGRGRYGTSDDPTADHTDRFFGFVDEVRISDNAVAPASFLFAGQAQNAGPRLIVDREAGTMNLVNMRTAIDLVSYRINSASGALNPDNWNSISGHQDADSGGGFDDNDTWDVFGQSSEELWEIEPDGDGGSLGSVLLGLANTWRRSRFEDLTMTVEELLPDLTTRTFSIPVQFTGLNGVPVSRSDLNVDGMVNGDDWEIFRANHLVAMTGLNVAQASVLGDLDNDIDNDFADFRLFQNDFDAANGVGALAALMAVPEPSSLVAGLLGAVALCVRRRLAG